MQAALVVVGFAKMMSQMGIGPALVQRKDLSETHIRVGFTFSLGLGIFMGILVFLGAGLIADFFRMESLKAVLRVVAFLFIMESFVTVSSSLIQRDMRLRERAIVEMCSYVFGYGLVGIIFGYLGYDYWALIIAIFAQEIIKMVAYVFLQGHSLLPYWRKKEFIDLIYFGGGFTLGKFFNYLASEGDNIITGRFLSADALGIYGRAYTLMNKPVNLLGDSIDKSLFPAMAARQHQPDKLIKAFISGSRLITFVCVPLSVIIISSAEEIVNVLLGSSWSGAIIPLQILTIGMLFRMGYKMGDSLCRATGHVYKRAMRQLIFAICLVGGCYLGTFRGIAGVAGGVVFAVTINYILMIHLSLSILKINWSYFLRRIFADLPIMIGLSALFLGIIYMVRLTSNVDFVRLLLAYGIFSAICALLFYHYSHKLSFLKVLPIEGLLKKITKQKP